MKERQLIGLALVLLVLGFFAGAKADEVQISNGDRYRGDIICFTNGILVLKSDVLGVVKLPRAKISVITFGNVQTLKTGESASGGAVTNVLPVVQDKETQKALAQLRAHTNLLSGIQSKFLSGAGSEANDKFTQMVNDLLSGKLSVADIRAEAGSAAAQLRAARNELGEDSSFAIDSYLAILERFLANSATPEDKQPPLGRD